MKQLSVLLCVFTCMYFLSCKKEADKKTPFNGTYVTTNQILNGPPMLQQRITGTGHATHLGKSSFVAISTLNLTTPPPFQLGGTAIFYAANGDEFYTTFAGTSTPIDGGRSNVVVNHTITGGTGRFEDASGYFVGTAIANPALPTGSITYEGYIRY